MSTPLFGTVFRRRARDPLAALGVLLLVIALVAAGRVMMVDVARGLAIARARDASPGAAGDASGEAPRTTSVRLARSPER